MPPVADLLNILRKLRMRMLRRQEDAATLEMADFLSEVPLFSVLSRGMLIELAEAVHERRYARDEALYFENDPGIGLYIVRSGSVRLVVSDGDGKTEVDTLAEHGVVGLDGVLGGGMMRRTESAEATCDTIVVGLFSPELRTLLRRHPKTAAAVLMQLARHQALILSELRVLLDEEHDRATSGRQAALARTRAVNRLGDLPAH